MQRNKVLSIFLKYYLDKNLYSQLSIDKIFLVKVWALARPEADPGRLEAQTASQASGLAGWPRGGTGK